MGHRQTEKSQRTRDELRETAQQLFNQNGYIATTVADITHSAGYAKGTFYLYWKSKEDLFLSIMAGRLADYRAARKEGLRKAKDIRDVLEVLIDFLESMIDDDNWAKVFLEFTIYASGRIRLRKELNKSIYRLSLDLFAEIIEPYKTTDFPAKKVGALVTALFEGFLIQNLLEIRAIDKEDLRKAILTIALSKVDAIGG
jgi:AcrR family transcriptional regulator